MPKILLPFLFCDEVKSVMMPENKNRAGVKPAFSFDDSSHDEVEEYPLDWEKARLDRKRSPAEIVGAAVRLFPALVPWWLRLFLALIMGIGIGVFLMRQKRAAEDVVMTIGKDRITGQEFYHRMEVAAGAEMLSKMESEKLTLQFVRQRKALPTEEAIQQRISEMMLQPEIADRMTHHMTQEDLHLQSQLQLSLEALYSNGVTVSENEMRDYYKQQSAPANPQAKFIVPASISIQVISAAKEETIRKAEQALINGEDFASAAREYSMDRSAVHGGFGPVLWRGHSQLTPLPEFEAAVFNLDKGQRLGPQKFGNVWWIVRCENRMLGRTLPFERVKDTCRSDLKLLKGQRMRAAQIEEDFVAFRKRVPVTLFWDRFYFDIQDQATQLASGK